ncbi:MAG: YesL family protein [Defluviitaleaceae bacterium]|nr:YesL family protein [Defluviitaleaceae bacterium]
MGGFFSLDGPFARFGNMVFDVMMLSLLWLVFSIPIFTAGAATVSLFYVTTRRVSNKEGYLFRDFWNSFRSNFKQATVCWLIILLLAAVLFINILNIDILGGAAPFILPIQIFLALELFIISLYVFPIIARFELTFTEVFKNAFFMANRHLLMTLALIIIGAGVLVISLSTILFFLFAMGTYATLAAYPIMRVFRKYRPEMDKDGMLE